MLLLSMCPNVWTFKPGVYQPQDGVCLAPRDYFLCALCVCVCVHPRGYELHLNLYIKLSKFATYVSKCNEAILPFCAYLCGCCKCDECGFAALGLSNEAHH